MTQAISIGQTLEALAAKLTQIGSAVPELRFVRVDSSYPLMRKLLHRILPRFEGLPLRFRQNPTPTNGVQYDCYYGDPDLEHEFKTLAAEVVGPVNTVMSALRAGTEEAGDTTPQFGSWFDFVQCAHRQYRDDDMLAIDRASYAVVSIAGATPYVCSLDREEDAEWLGDYVSEGVPPDAKCDVFSLRFDPYTVMATAIARFLADIGKLERDGSAVGEAALATAAGDAADIEHETSMREPATGVCSSLDSTGRVISQNPRPINAENDEGSASRPARRQRRRPAMEARPGWVNPLMLIGPTTMVRFAELLTVSEKTLRSLIKNGDIWREQGASANRFYFHHRDWKTNQNLLHSFNSTPAGSSQR